MKIQIGNLCKLPINVEYIQLEYCHLRNSSCSREHNRFADLKKMTQKYIKSSRRKNILTSHRNIFLRWKRRIPAWGNKILPAPAGRYTRNILTIFLLGQNTSRRGPNFGLDKIFFFRPCLAGGSTRAKKKYFVSTKIRSTTGRIFALQKYVWDVSYSNYFLSHRAKNVLQDAMNDAKKNRLGKAKTVWIIETTFCHNNLTCAGPLLFIPSAL